MRVPHIMLWIAGCAAWFLACGAGPSSPTLKNGLLFSGLRVCPNHRHLTFEVSAFNGFPADTLCSDVTTGKLHWGGGPIRGLSSKGDTTHLATLLGFYSITPEGTLFSPWKQPLGGVLQDWDIVPGALPGHQFGEEQPFPERYLPQKDGTIVFLVDGEHAPDWNTRWHDLHLRTPEGTEWLAARNLAVYGWVLSSDSTHWAMSARAWIPDYGGREKFILMAGTGDRVERFDTGKLKFCTWDDANRLWAVNEEGRLIRIQPNGNVWEMSSIQLAEHSCSTTPSVSDSVWTWVWPEPFSAYNAARIFASRHGQGWVAQSENEFWACWTGYLHAADLERSWTDAPVEGGISQAMSIMGSDFLGTAQHFRSKQLEGEATLKHVLQGDTRFSELWWRYPGQHAVRLAGPWTSESRTNH